MKGGVMGLQFQQRFHIIDRTQVDGDQETLAVSGCDDCACPTPPVVAVSDFLYWSA